MEASFSPEAQQSAGRDLASLGQLMRAMSESAARVESTLDNLLDERERPPRLIAAMRYATLVGGKRIRPLLVQESAALMGQEGEGAARLGAAVEIVHAYSLIHDDLPALDDDALRRGKPTTHRAFDEATALLAGDALQTLAFAILADRRTARRAATRVRLIAGLAQASGIDGMVGGQMRDLAAEGRFEPSGSSKKLSLRAIGRLQAEKTGALIAFAASGGALLAPNGGPARERRALLCYGQALGRAFQIRDDLLDAQGSVADLGKAVAKDAGRGKATFVAALGPAGAERELERVSRKGAEALVSVFGGRAQTLIELLEFNRLRLA